MVDSKLVLTVGTIEYMVCRDHVTMAIHLVEDFYFSASGLTSQPNLPYSSSSVIIGVVKRTPLRSGILY